MKSAARILVLAFLSLAAGVAFAQSTIRVRGTITAFDGQRLSVKTREGDHLRIDVPANVRIAYPKAMKMQDIKPGTGLGTSAVKGKDDTLIAREIHIFPAGRPVPGEGHRPWDLEPGSTMTNAVVTTSTVTANNGRELTLTYPGGSKRVIVPVGTPIVMAVPGDRSLLEPGAYVFLAARKAPGGKLSAFRIQVSKDGVRPPE